MDETPPEKRPRPNSAAVLNRNERPRRTVMPGRAQPNSQGGRARNMQHTALWPKSRCWWGTIGISQTSVACSHMYWAPSEFIVGMLPGFW